MWPYCGSWGGGPGALLHVHEVDAIAPESGRAGVADGQRPVEREHPGHGALVAERAQLHRQR